MSERTSNASQSTANTPAAWGFAVSLATIVLTPVVWIVFIGWSLQGLGGWDDGQTTLGDPSSTQVSLALILLLTTVLAGVVSGLLLSMSGLARAKEIDGCGHRLAIAGVAISGFGLAGFLLAAFAIALG